MTIERKNGIADLIRYYPCNVREISTHTTIPAPVVEKYIAEMVASGEAEVSHSRKLKGNSIPYYRLTNRVKVY